MSKLIILRGMPGSGKTSLARWLWAPLSDARHPYEVDMFAADDYFYKKDPSTGEISYRFDPKKLGRAHQQCQDSVRKFMTDMAHRRLEGIAIVHNTNTTEKEVKPYADLAEEFGWEFISLIVENRHGNKSLHNVPDEALDRMRDRFSVKL